MKDRVEELASVLRQQANAMLGRYPALSHIWVDAGAVVTLKFPPVDASGFDVDLQVGNGYAYVLVGHSHYSFNLRRGPPEPVIQKALEVVRQLLSPMMRVREYQSNGRPYRWLVEKHVNGSWELDLEEDLVFFNYFGKRTEHVYQNKQLSVQ